MLLPVGSACWTGIHSSASPKLVERRERSQTLQTQTVTEETTLLRGIPSTHSHSSPPPAPPRDSLHAPSCYFGDPAVTASVCGVGREPSASAKEDDQDGRRLLCWQCSLSSSPAGSSSHPPAPGPLQPPAPAVVTWQCGTSSSNPQSQRWHQYQWQHRRPIDDCSLTRRGVDSGHTHMRASHASLSLGGSLRLRAKSS
eukprot:3784745-Rhodomonas_salina.1